jgi:hypothetical protein
MINNTSKNISVKNGGELPPKQNVYDMTFKSFLESMGFMTLGNLIHHAFTKEHRITGKEALKYLAIDATVASTVATIDNIKVRNYNKKIDEELAKQKAESHVQRYEQEKLANSQAPQIQGR